jgi:hypothetical protein
MKDFDDTKVHGKTINVKKNLKCVSESKKPFGFLTYFQVTLMMIATAIETS